MRNFRYYLPANDIIFGSGSLSSVGVEAKRFGKKALLVTGKSSMKRLGFLEKCVDFLKKD